MVITVKRRLRMLVAIAIPLAALSGLASSCKDSNNDVSHEVVDTTSINTGTLFDYKAIVQKNLYVELSTNGNPIGYTRFWVFEKNPLIYRADGSFYRDTTLLPLVDAITDNDGDFSDIISIPTSITKLYVYTTHVGVPMLLSAKVTSSNQISISSTGKMDGDGDDVKSLSASYNTVNISNCSSIPTSWDLLGKPDNLYATRDVVPPYLLQSVHDMLPEGVDVRKNNPELIQAGAVTTCTLQDTCTLDVTFVHEGAGYLNVLGYYYYPTNTPPASLNNIKKYIAFPNTSYLNSGGELASGDRMRLKYWDGAKSSEKFPPGLTVAWFIAANGYNSSTGVVSRGINLYSSVPDLNPETTTALRQHNVLLVDNTSKIIVITFEDMNRMDGGCDHDFNDAIFYATPTPFRAVKESGMTPLEISKDSDGDGIPDDTDEFPNDVNMAYTQDYPSKGVNGSLTFEDLWPWAGDYDMNDVCLDYHTIHYLNAKSQVVKSSTNFTLRSAGCKYRNGFAFQMGVAPSAVKSVTVTGGSLSKGVIAVDAKGLESGQALSNVVVFDDVYSLFNEPAGAFVNTQMSKTKHAYKNITVDVMFNTPQTLAALTVPPYNPYIIVDCGNGKRGVEVHLAGQKPTTKADAAKLSTGIDLTSYSKGIFYVAKSNMPWALHLPKPLIYPVETISIKKAYPHFVDWVTSNGAQYTDWYSNSGSGYRVNSILYTK